MLKKRVEEEAALYRGRIDDWIVANEVPLNHPKDSPAVAEWYNTVGNVESIGRILRWARAANPDTHLLVNHFDFWSPGYFGLVHDARIHRTIRSIRSSGPGLAAKNSAWTAMNSS